MRLKNGPEGAFAEGVTKSFASQLDEWIVIEMPCMYLRFVKSSPSKPGFRRGLTSVG